MEDWVYFTLFATRGRYVRVNHIVMDYRMRGTSLSMTSGLNIARYKPALDAVFGHPDVICRFDPKTLKTLRARREAAICNFIAAQCVRSGKYAGAFRAYGSSIARSIAKSPKGAMMMGLACFGF